MKALFYKTIKPIVQPFQRAFKGSTLGVRVVVLKSDQVLLVQHSYAPGWLLPGGGVERGETVYEAAARELAEEAGITVTAPLTLHGLFSNEKLFPGDHVACFVARDFEQQTWKPNLEIRAAEFFKVNDLPEGATGGSRRRITEILGQSPVAERW